MDDPRFDRLVQSFASTTSRRQSLGIAASGLLAVLPWHDIDAKHKHKKKKKKRKHGPCVGSCQGKTCGSDGCTGSCGDCDAPLTCQSGNCACPTGTEECGGECVPLCPASTPGRVVARRPDTCACCVRPGSIPCPNNIEQCCVEPDGLPCCGPPCDPMAVNPDCREALPCHYDVECAVGRHCPPFPENPDPRLCEDDHP
jgi:hypothetical protein